MTFSFKYKGKKVHVTAACWEGIHILSNHTSNVTPMYIYSAQWEKDNNAMATNPLPETAYKQLVSQVKQRIDNA